MGFFSSSSQWIASYMSIKCHCCMKWHYSSFVRSVIVRCVLWAIKNDALHCVPSSCHRLCWCHCHSEKTNNVMDILYKEKLREFQPTLSLPIETSRIFVYIFNENRLIFITRAYMFDIACYERTNEREINSLLFALFKHIHFLSSSCGVHLKSDLLAKIMQPNRWWWYSSKWLITHKTGFLFRPYNSIPRFFLY